jgi:hypothetical protein
LAIKSQKLVELMMVSGIPTASGYEERIRFSELEVVESGAIDHGVLSTLPEGNYINGWDVNVAGVGVKSVKRNIRYHKHAVNYKCPSLERQRRANIPTGIPSKGKEERGSGVLYWPQIWRLRSNVQEVTYRTPREGLTIFT